MRADAYPYQLIDDRRLADGTPVRIRPIVAEDRLRHWRFVCSLSLQTRYQRLMSPRSLMRGELRRMVEIDYHREMALVAVTGVGTDERELGIARYVLADAAGASQGPFAEGAEFAIVVADAWQRRGIGDLLLQSLRDAAIDAGVTELGGITLATNSGMIRLARRLGFEVSPEPGDWTVRRMVWRQPEAARSASASADAPGAAASSTAPCVSQPAPHCRAA